MIWKKQKNGSKRIPFRERPTQYVIPPELVHAIKAKKMAIFELVRLGIINDLNAECLQADFEQLRALGSALLTEQRIENQDLIRKERSQVETTLTIIRDQLVAHEKELEAMRSNLDFERKDETNV